MCCLLAIMKCIESMCVHATKDVEVILTTFTNKDVNFVLLGLLLGVSLEIKICSIIYCRYCNFYETELSYYEKLYILMCNILGLN